jgi:hypothetical protein
VKKLLCVLLTSFCFTLRLSAQEPDYKDPKKARAIAFFIPGGGHIYAGAPHIGVPLLAVSALVLGASYYEENHRVCSEIGDDGVRHPVPCTDRGGAAVRKGWIAFGVIWAISLWDAPRAADRFNDRLSDALSHLGVQAEPMVASGSGGSTRVGVALRIR